VRRRPAWLYRQNRRAVDSPSCSCRRRESHVSASEIPVAALGPVGNDAERTPSAPSSAGCMHRLRRSRVERRSRSRITWFGQHHEQQRIVLPGPGQHRSIARRRCVCARTSLFMIRPAARAVRTHLRRRPELGNSSLQTTIVPDSTVVRAIDIRMQARVFRLQHLLAAELTPAAASDTSRGTICIASFRRPSEEVTF